MKVILLQNVANIGTAGTVKEVRNGYSFNFLLPKGLAKIATPQAIAQAKKLVLKLTKEQSDKLADLKALATSLADTQVVIKMKAEKGTLFGSVGSEEIATALKISGKYVDAKVLKIEKPIKTVGIHTVEADFGRGVKASFDVSVESE